MGKTTFLENKQLDVELNGGTYSAPTLYAMLFTAAAGNDPSSWTEVGTSIGYSRQNISAAIAAAASGQAVSDVAISFGPSSATWGGDVVAIGTIDSSSGAGNIYRASYLITDAGWRIAVALDTDTWYCAGHGFSDNDYVILEQDEYASLPTGVSQGTGYYIISSTTDTFQVSASQGGAAVNITASSSCRIAEYTPRTIDAANYTLTFAVGDFIAIES